jgi:hypothetical protein
MYKKLPYYTIFTNVLLNKAYPVSPYSDYHINRYDPGIMDLRIIFIN